MLLPDVIGVYRDMNRTTTFVRGENIWCVRMSTPLSELHSRALLDIYESGRGIISNTPVLPHNSRGTPGVGSGVWVVCSLEALDSLCALIDTHAPTKPVAVPSIAELVGAKLLDPDLYFPHSL